MGASLGLSFGADELEGAELEKEIMREALRRGADEIDLMRIQWKLQVKRNARMAWRPATGARLLETADVLSVDPDIVQDANKRARDACIREYQNTMQAELSRLPDLQDDFGSDDDEQLRTYCVIRAGMYAAGYDDPVKTVFLKIRKGKKLAGKVVGGGLHDKFIEKLAGLESKLNGMSPGLVDKVSKQITKVWGFVPRHIKGSSSLSNHAFGLAVDINENSNPHIGGNHDTKMIEFVKQVTGYDFGSPLFPQDVCALDAEEIQQIYNQQKDASDRLRAWLQQYLPVYEASLSKKPAQPPPLIEQDWTKDYSEDPLQTAKTLLDPIYAAHKNDLRVWAKEGIQTIPLVLAVAMKELGFRWGSEYKSSKDVMHFELEYQKVLDRDVQTPRPLKALLDAWIDPPAEKVSAPKKAAARKAQHG